MSQQIVIVRELMVLFFIYLAGRRVSPVLQDAVVSQEAGGDRRLSMSPARRRRRHSRQRPEIGPGCQGSVQVRPRLEGSQRLAEGCQPGEWIVLQRSLPVC